MSLFVFLLVLSLFVTDRQALMNATNNDREIAGLKALRNEPRLQVQADRWARQMATDGALSHRPDLALLPRLVRTKKGRCVVGENVGFSSLEGDTIDRLEDAYMASPLHRENVLKPDWQTITIGTHRQNARLWVDVIFLRCSA